MHITYREASVLELIAKGCTDREIAEKLGVKNSTARKHRENIMLKLDVSKSTELAIFYLASSADVIKKSR